VMFAVVVYRRHSSSTTQPPHPPHHHHPTPPAYRNISDLILNRCMNSRVTLCRRVDNQLFPQIWFEHRGYQGRLLHTCLKFRINCLVWVVVGLGRGMPHYIHESTTCEKTHRLHVLVLCEQKCVDRAPNNMGRKQLGHSPNRPIEHIATSMPSSVRLFAFYVLYIFLHIHIHVQFDQRLP